MFNKALTVRKNLHIRGLSLACVHLWLSELGSPNLST